MYFSKILIQYESTNEKSQVWAFAFLLIFCVCGILQPCAYISMFWQQKRQIAASLQTSSLLIFNLKMGFHKHTNENQNPSSVVNYALSFYPYRSIFSHYLMLNFPCDATIQIHIHTCIYNFQSVLTSYIQKRIYKKKITMGKVTSPARLNWTYCCCILY